jgi:hypothetical protein
VTESIGRCVRATEPSTGRRTFPRSVMSTHDIGLGTWARLIVLLGLAGDLRKNDSRPAASIPEQMVMGVGFAGTTAHELISRSRYHSAGTGSEAGLRVSAGGWRGRRLVKRSRYRKTTGVV